MKKMRLFSLFLFFFILLLVPNVYADTNISPKSGVYGVAGSDYFNPDFYTNFSAHTNYGSSVTIPNGYTEIGLIRYYTYFNSGVVTSANSYTYKYKICGGSQYGKTANGIWEQVDGVNSDGWKAFKKNVTIYSFLYNTSSEAITGASEGDPKKLVSELQIVSGQPNCLYHIISFTPESSYRAVGFFVKYGTSTGFWDSDSNNKVTVSLVSLTQKEGVGGIIKNQTDKVIEEQQKTNEHLDDIENTLNDDDTTSQANDFSNFFNSFTTDNHGLTGIITAPLNAINSLTSSTCSPLELPLPFIPGNKKLTLPCMRPIYQQHFGAFMTLYDTITFGIVAYWVCVRIFAMVKDFKNPEHDEIEVMDL